jgi:hypothetical protein
VLATLLRSQLGVNATTEGQPESAVALGLHHVPVGRPIQSSCGS